MRVDSPVGLVSFFPGSSSGHTTRRRCHDSSEWSGKASRIRLRMPPEFVSDSKKIETGVDDAVWLVGRSPTKCKQIGGQPHIQSTAKRFKVKAVQLAPVLRVAFRTCSDHNKSRGRDTVLSQFNCLHFVLRRTLNDL